MTVAIDLTGGGSVLAWQTTDGVFFERYDANLDPIGTPIEVASGEASWVSAKPLDGGGFTVYWDTGVGSSTIAQDFNASGAAVGSTYSVAAPPTAPTAFTSLASPDVVGSNGWDSSTAILPDDGYATASFANPSGQWLEQIQHYDAAGNAVGPAYTLQPGTASAYGANQVAVLADGSYVVSYLHQSNYSSQSDIERFAADGTHLGTVTIAQLAFTGNFTYFPEVLSQSVAGLPDGGFVVSWTAQNNAPPQVFVQEFTASGNAVAPPQMLGAATSAAPEIDAFPNGKYTVTWTTPTGPQSESFSEQGSPLAPGNNDTIATSLATYVLPEGPHDVILTGTEAQTVTGNSLGDTITSNDAGSTLIGGSGNDTLIAGHGADSLTGGGGADTFVFKAMPWNAGQITDFTLGTDKIDLSALLTAAGYTGSDPVADGYVTFASDGHGDTQIYFNPHSASQSWPMLVTTLDHVAPTGLTAVNVLGYSESSSGGGSTGGGNSSPIDVSDAIYNVPAGVTDIVLTGTAAQHITANNLGDVITSNDHGSTIIGGTGDDTLIAGHSADMLTGGGGTDTFVFDAVPWSAGQITDFTPGTDKLDLSALLSAASYTGSDPVADGYVTFASDGHDDTQVFFNAHSASDPWPSLITTLDNLAPAGLTAANVLGDASTSGSGGSSTGGSTGGSTGSSVDTSAASYTAPADVTSIVLTSNSAQTVTANNLGDTITSNDAASTIIGGTGNDTLIAGHGADTLTGGGGNDSFVFNVLPWNAGQITDFNPSVDVLDLHGIFAGIGYTGSNPVADGYLNFVADGSGNTKVYVDQQGPSTTIPILVTTLDHVAPSALHQGDYIFA
ncbi:MAG TPA: type I secretion C-terminal target domain-containing protein [Stellaceae bacterium]|jgi:Ca2+-binding RTX toxin-like protein|nr:type I secretion C-terminal target domain-containing protein [Stellaceae bacterium]